MPIVQIAQSLGLFLFVCLVSATVLSLIVIGLERLEVAAFPTGRREADDRI